MFTETRMLLALVITVLSLQRIVEAEISSTTIPTANLCQDVTCPLNSECRLREVQCFRAPCNPVPECVAITVTLSSSTKFCPEPPCARGCVLNNGPDGCPTCYCPSCETTTCQPEYQCQMLQVECEVEPCFSKPVCVPNSSTAATCPPLINCNLTCSNGQVKDERGCDTCNCKNCPDSCLGRFCLYGRVKDSDGCTTCDCVEPCEEISCSANQQCNIVMNATTNTYVGQCINFVSTMPRTPCQNVTCTNVSECPAGFKHDSNGCKMCECFDPCQSYSCPDDKKCQLTSNDCPPGDNCRDGPMPICVDKSTTISPTSQMMVRRTTRRRETISQCCVNEGISGSCLSVCSNITNLSSNLDMLSGCFQYLGKILHCASGGNDYTNCCRERGMSESCLLLCSGQDNIDISNPHSVNQCITSSGVTVLDCFTQDVTRYLSTTTVPPSISTSDICSMSPDPGSCKTENTERWYYSAEARACAVFFYGGCGGNGNSFASRDECLARCSHNGSVCPMVLCPSECQATVDGYGCSTCQCGNSCLSDGCPSHQECQMIPGTCPSNVTNCPLVPTCISKPDFICEPVPNCTLTCSNGWMTDSTGCPICQCKQCEIACLGMVCSYGRVKGSDGCDTCECFQPCERLSCPDQCRIVRDNSTQNYYGECYSSASTPTSSTTASLCFLTPDFGMSCQANSTVWFYNHTTNACSPFTFGGCLGNNNNFQTLKLCEMVCKDSRCSTPICSLADKCDYGLKTDSKGCQLCQCLDPCEGMTCPDNKVCVSQKVDCAANETCRDPFTRQCVDPMSLSTTVRVPSSHAPGCSQVACLIYCQYGFEKDANGCPVCHCQNPCKNCTADQKCVLMTLECPTNDPGCPDSIIGNCVDVPTTMTTAVIPPYTSRRCLLCMMHCFYGMMKDANGCAVCHCYNPCEGVQCDGNMTCQVLDLDCPNGTDCQPNIRYIGQCAESTTAAPRQTTKAIVTTTTPTTVSMSTKRPCIACAMFCDYGMPTGADGCPICQCYEPCKFVFCDRGQKCEVVRQNCSDCEPDMKYIGQCVSLTTTIASTLSSQAPSISTRASSTVTPCPRLSCLNPCQYGTVKNSFGCETCQCVNPCLGVICRSNQTCEVENTHTCIEDMCSPAFVGKCVDVCPPMDSCRLSNCAYGLAKDDIGCSICKCFQPCQNITCQTGSECTIKNKTICAAGKCSTDPVGSCTVICPSISDCQLPCRFGFKKDTIGCPQCQCYNSCEIDCVTGQTCVPDPTPVFTGSPPERIYTSRCIYCQRQECDPNLKSCQYERKKDDVGCEKCDCYDPCQNAICPPGTFCEQKPMFDGLYNYSKQCTPCPVPTCENICLFGTVMENGCPTCTCKPNPCYFQDECPNYNEVCQATICPVSNDTCQPSRACIDKSHACEDLQKAYLDSFSNNLYRMPQLNCDSNGVFKPIQCSDFGCWCSDLIGNFITNVSAQVQNCYSRGQVKKIFKIDADINIIKPGDGWKFKQLVSQQIANFLNINESLVTIIKYEKGSIMTTVIFGNDRDPDFFSSLDNIEPFSIEYDNSKFNITVVNNGTMEPSTTTSSVHSKSTIIDSTLHTKQAPVDNTLLIILVCIFVPVAFLAIIGTVWFACKIVRGERMIPSKRLSESSKASTEVDSLESGSEKGSYNSDKYIPPEKHIPPEKYGTTEA